MSQATPPASPSPVQTEIKDIISEVKACPQCVSVEKDLVELHRDLIAAVHALETISHAHGTSLLKRALEGLTAHLHYTKAVVK